MSTSRGPATAQAHQLWHWAPGVSVSQRDHAAVQFGLDATRAGVIETPCATELTAALRAIDHPITRQQWLAATGLEPTAARSLFEDLVAYGIVSQATKPASVVILGTGDLAEELARVLGGDDWALRAPIGTESRAQFLRTIARSALVVAVGAVTNAQAAATMLVSAGVKTWLPVTLVDNRGFIGPARLDGVGPCPLCFNLHQSDKDPRWSPVVEQLDDAALVGAGDPLVVRATATHTAIMLRKMAGLSRPPGVARWSVLPGEFIDVDLYGRTQRRVFVEHPRCPVCFAASSIGPHTDFDSHAAAMLAPFE